MSKASIRKLFAQPPPSIEEILAKREEESKRKLAADDQVEVENKQPKLSSPVANEPNEQHSDHPTPEQLQTDEHNNDTEHAKIAPTASVTNIDSNGSTLDLPVSSNDQMAVDPVPPEPTIVSNENKRKEPDLDIPVAFTAIKKLKPSSLSNGASPIQSISTSGRSSPSVKKENSPAISQPQQGFSFIDSLLAGLKKSAIKPSSAPQSPQKSTDTAASVTPSSDTPPIVKQDPSVAALSQTSNQRPALPVNVKQPVTFPAFSNPPQSLMQQNLVQPSLYPTNHISMPARDQGVPQPVKLTRKEKKKLNRKKKKQQKAALNHKDVNQDLDDLDFDTLLQQHEKLSKAKETSKESSQAPSNNSAPPSTAQSQAPSNNVAVPSNAQAQAQTPQAVATIPAATSTINEKLVSQTQPTKAKAKNTPTKYLDPLAGYLPAKSSKLKAHNIKTEKAITDWGSEATALKLHDSAPVDVSKVQTQAQQQKPQNDMATQHSAAPANAPININSIEALHQKLKNGVINQPSAPQINAPISTEKIAPASAVAKPESNVSDIADNAELLLRSTVAATKGKSKGAQPNKQSGANGKKQPQSQKKGQQSNKRKFVPTVPCSFFMKGFCKDGDKCTFRHEGNPVPPPPPTKLTTVCQFYKTGSCVAGDECKFSHNLKLEPCRFFHLQGSCELDPNCPYSHEPLNEDRLQRLRILTGPCRFYHFKGYCNTGDLCMFSHDEVSEEEKKKVESTILACRYYHLKGACRSGDDCFYLHQEASPEQIKNLKPFNN